MSAAPEIRARDASAGGDLAIDIAEPCTQWRAALPQVACVCEAAARAALATAGETPTRAELSILLGDDELLRALNRKWRGIDTPTNVLSFPALETGQRVPPGLPRLMGDVVLAFETVAAEAAAQAKPLAHHLGHLVVHGVLHLLGWDHTRADEAERMEALETEALARLGVPDPYQAREAHHG
jgi:probable rRNA maturation factor